MWWAWSSQFLCNGGFNVALINLKNGLVRQLPLDANRFSCPWTIEFDGFSEFF